MEDQRVHIKKAKQKMAGREANMNTMKTKALLRVDLTLAAHLTRDPALSHNRTNRRTSKKEAATPSHLRSRR